LIDLEGVREHIEGGAKPVWKGRVDVVSGVIVEAVGVPAAMGDMCRIRRGRLGPVDAEVVGFRGATTLLMPHGDVEGIAPRQEVVALGRSFRVPVGSALLGRVVDGFGEPMDDAPLDRSDLEERRVRTEAPTALSRQRIDEPLTTGVRAIDGLLTVGKGQRLGIFSGSGVGKSTLLGQIARGTDADVVVVCMVGERGREVRSFLEDVLGEEGRKRSVAVVATSDRPPIERYLAPFVATTIAESFRDQGLDVLLLMDSVTRFALASREIGLAAGEPPTVRGYPPSFFATIPKLVERLGRSDKGSITGLITVLLDADDPNDPVSDTLRGLLDGHVFLDRELAQQGHFPAIDVLGSLSRLMPELVTPEHRELATLLRGHLASWKEGRDLVQIGAYRPGADPRLDEAILRMEGIEAFLRQDSHGGRTPGETLQMLAAALAPEGFAQHAAGSAR
jgi:flagellum-specific ATP synthase